MINLLDITPALIPNLHNTVIIWECGRVCLVDLTDGACSMQAGVQLESLFIREVHGRDGRGIFPHYNVLSVFMQLIRTVLVV
jgi:hypothetical protein